MRRDINKAKRKYLIKILVNIDKVGYDASWLLETPYKKIDYLKLRNYFIEEYLPDLLKKDGYDSIEEFIEWDGEWINAPLNNFVNFYG
jgi:hypothetical protein